MTIDNNVFVIGDEHQALSRLVNPIKINTYVSREWNAKIIRTDVRRNGIRQNGFITCVVIIGSLLFLFLFIFFTGGIRLPNEFFGHT